MVGKLPGRIGDTPILGSGTYADNGAGGVSTTGHGETIMRFNLATRILEGIRHENKTAQQATEAAVEAMTSKLGQTAGAITIDRDRNVGFHFSSNVMAWAYIRSDEPLLHYGIERGDNFTEDAN